MFLCHQRSLLVWALKGFHKIPDKWQCYKLSECSGRISWDSWQMITLQEKGGRKEATAGFPQIAARDCAQDLVEQNYHHHLHCQHHNNHYHHLKEHPHHYCQKISKRCLRGIQLDWEYMGDLCIYSNPMETLIYGHMKNCVWDTTREFNCWGEEINPCNEPGHLTLLDPPC